MEFGRKLRAGGGLRMEISMVLLGMMMMMMISIGVSQGPSSPTLHKVGGNKGWTENVNYTQWALQDHFFLNDWLLFRFDKRYYNVLEVNQTSYDYCNDQSFITNITKGGRDVFQLTQARTYYFIGGGGYCFHGMKLTINVTIYQAPSPSSSPSTTPTHSSSTRNVGAGPFMLLLALIIMVYICCH